MINASHNANEWMTSLVIMLFAEKYLNLYKNKEIYKGYNICELWDKTSIYIIPMVNPDGVNLFLKEDRVLENDEYKYIWEPHINSIEGWEANIRGVDINANYPVGWKEARKLSYKKGITSPGPRGFVGLNSISEVETLNMISFTELHEFDLTISLQSQGKKIYWSYQDIKKTKELGEKFTKVSGYALVESKYDSSFAGYEDWYINTYNKPGFAVGIGKWREGATTILDKAREICKEVEEIFLLAAQEI